MNVWKFHLWMNTRVSIMEEERLIIPLTWRRPSAEIYWDVCVCMCVILLFCHHDFPPWRLWARELLFGTQQYMGVDAHTCLMSHSHLQHTRGQAKIDIALPEGSQEVRATLDDKELHQQSLSDVTPKRIFLKKCALHNWRLFQTSNS